MRKDKTKGPKQSNVMSERREVKGGGRDEEERRGIK